MTWAWKPNPALKRELDDAVQRGLDAGIDVIFEASQDLVPVEKGDLKRSGRIVTEGNRRRIVYDDEAAVFVHEDLDAQHGDGQAKFLEEPMNRERQRVLRAIAGEIRRTTG